MIVRDNRFCKNFFLFITTIITYSTCSSIHQTHAYIYQIPAVTSNHKADTISTNDTIKSFYLVQQQQQQQEQVLSRQNDVKIVRKYADNPFNRALDGYYRPIPSQEDKGKINSFFNKSMRKRLPRIVNLVKSLKFITKKISSNVKGKIYVTSNIHTPATITAKNNSSINTKSVASNAKYGTLEYSYPNQIIENEGKTIHAFLSIAFPESKIRDTLIKIIEFDDRNQKGDSVVIIKGFKLYKKVFINITSMDKSIQVLPVDSSMITQDVDTVGGNQWSWKILANSAEQDSSKLKLVIKTFGPSSYSEKTIYIHVKVKPISVKEIYDLAMDNKKYIFSSLLLPLLGYIVVLFKRKNYKSTDKEVGKS